MRKSLLLFSLAILSSQVTFAADEAGQTFKIGDITYAVKSENTVGVSKVTSSVTSVTLTPTVSYENKDYSVVSIDRDAFYYSKATSITIPSTVESIEYGAFRSSSLATVKFADNGALKKIDDYAFSSTKLASIEIPEGVTYVGSSCFFTCSNLASVKLPSTLETIGGSCFYKCSFSSIEIPDGVTSIGKSAFLFCKNLKSIKLPSGMTEISAGLLQGTALTSVDIPEGVEIVGDEALLDVKTLTSVTLPASLKSVGNGSFAGTSIKSFGLNAANKNLTVVDDALYTADKSLLLAYPCNADNTVVNVAKGCRGISGGAFWKTKVTKVTLPESIIAFDSYAFCQAESLTDINFPKSVVYFGEQAFAGTAISELVIPEGVCELPEAVFAQCTKLKSVTIPSSMSYIDIRNFWKCTSLQAVNCLGSQAPVLEDWYEADESPFYDVPSSAKLNVPAGCESSYSGDANWKSVFGSANIVGSLPGYFIPSEITPATDTEVSVLESIVFSFGEAATVVKSSPDIKLQAGPLTAGVPTGGTVSVDQWMVVKDGANGIKIFPADYDGYTDSKKLEKGTDYYVTIPGGVVKNANGEFNEYTVLHYTGSYSEPVLEPVSFDPANDANIKSFSGVTLNFDEDVTADSKLVSSVKFIKGELVEGVPTGTSVTANNYDFEEWRLTTSKRSPRIWPADMDYFTVTLSLPAGADYYFVVPAKMFKNSASVYNKQIIIHYGQGSSGIEGVDVSDSAILISAADGRITVNAADARVEVYSIDGLKAAESVTTDGEAVISGLQGGIYIVRATQGDKVKVAKVRI